ncbi:MAG TPA: hypothetical protein VGD98_09780 [Ktedonobacteraceae bacterium]
MRRLFLILLLAMLLAACSNAYPASSNDGGPIGSSTSQSQVVTGMFQEFALPQTKSGLMRPVIDAQGRVWFGEMNRNYLGAYDPRSKSFWQGTPPSGKAGVMGIIATPDDTIWFAEQYANYIGHFSPQSGQYRIYALPMIVVPDPSKPGQTQSLPSAPNDLALDQQHATLWFTELNANQLGSLNTRTGLIREYPLTREPNAQAQHPYGITVDAHGMVWFSEATSSRLGQLDPASGKVSYFTPPGVTAPLMELANDARGQIWATTFANSQLLQFDPVSARFTIYSTPGSGSLYGLLSASNGDVWVAPSAGNLLVRLATRERRFYSYLIPTANSVPLGLAEDRYHAIWFTESGSDKIGVLHL